jgi:hypothetical protein
MLASVGMGGGVCQVEVAAGKQVKKNGSKDGEGGQAESLSHARWTSGNSVRLLLAG